MGFGFFLISQQLFTVSCATWPVRLDDHTVRDRKSKLCSVPSVYFSDLLTVLSRVYADYILLFCPDVYIFFLPHHSKFTSSVTCLWGHHLRIKLKLCALLLLLFWVISNSVTELAILQGGVSVSAFLKYGLLNWRDQRPEWLLITLQIHL